MVQDYKIKVYLAVTSHKYAKIVTSQILSQSCVDNLVLLVKSEDSYTKGFVQTAATEHDGKIEIVNLPNSKNLESSISEYFHTIQHKKNDICVYLGDYICFLAPDCIEELSKFTIDNPEYEMIYPSAVNTERTTYIFQITNHLKPKLLWRWNSDYLDDYSFKNTPLEFHIEVHESFIEEAESIGLSKFKFGHYTLNPREVKPKHAFAMSGDTFNSHFKSLKSNFFQTPEKHIVSAFCGRALCSWFTNGRHKIALESSDLLSKYQKLGQIIYSSNYQSKYSTAKDDISEFDTGLTLGAMFGETHNHFEIKFAISSHISTQHKTLPVLLKSLSEAQIDNENVLVVIGGSPKEYIERKNGVLHSYVTHNSFDHNAIIDIVEKDWGGDWWFIMHDTTKAGLKFQERLLNIGPKASHVAALKEGWLNMGLFSKEALRDMSGYILQLKNCNKMQAILSEKLYTRMSDCAYFDVVEQINFPYYGDIYGDGVERQVMHMPTIDLYKFQSFHYHSESTKKIIDEWVMR